MMTLSEVRKILVMILAVVMTVVLVSCASTSDEAASGSSSSGESIPCDECENHCEGQVGEEKADCIEMCMRDCLP
jgi:hypothetical protein